MAKVNYTFESFMLGEISPQSRGKASSDVYTVSCKTLDNMLIETTGNATRCPGFSYVGATKVITETRLITLRHSNGSEYTLEFSDLAFRIYKDGVLQGVPTVVTTPFTSAQLPTLDFEISGSKVYIAHEDHPPQRITRVSDTDWTIEDIPFVCPPMYPLDDSTYGRTEDLGNISTTISSLSANTLGGSATLVMSGAIFAATDVGKFIRIKNFTSNPQDEANAQITVTQTAVNVLTSDGYTASTDSANGVAAAAVPNTYVKLPAITTATRTTPYSTIVTTTSRTYVGTSAGSSGSTISSANGVAAWITDVNSGSVITNETTTVTGNETETWGLVKITGYTNTSTVTVEIIRELSSTNFHSTQQWQMSRFGSVDGYPRKVSFYEGRMVLSAIGEGSNILTASKTNKLLDFEAGEGKEGTITAATGLYFELSEVETIKWVYPAQKLIIGGSNGVWSLSGGNNTGLNSLIPPIFKKITASSCTDTKPSSLHGTTFFTYEFGKRIGQIIFQPGEFSGFDFKDGSKYSSHLLTSGVKYMTQSGDRLWVVTTDGSLISATYDSDNNVVGLQKNTRIGNFETLTELGGRIAVCVTRTINSVATQYFERMGEISYTASKEDYIFVDSAVTYEGSPTTNITGLDHLEGEIVEILADGTSHSDKTVIAGAIALSVAASKVHVGLGYVGIVTTNEIPVGNRRGSNEGSKARIWRAAAKLLATNGALLQAGDSEDTILFNENQVFGSGTNLFTGTKRKVINSGFDLNPTITIKTQKALPLSVLNISAEINVSES